MSTTEFVRDHIRLSGQVLNLEVDLVRKAQGQNVPSDVTQRGRVSRLPFPGCTGQTCCLCAPSQTSLLVRAGNEESSDGSPSVPSN